jgi:hypothetical protein
MTRARKLGGWWRLWIVLSALWLVVVLVFGTLIFNDLSTESQLRKWAAMSACKNFTGSPIRLSGVEVNAYDDKVSWRELAQTVAFSTLAPTSREMVRAAYYEALILPEIGSLDEPTVRSAFDSDTRGAGGPWDRYRTADKGRRAYEVKDPTGRSYFLSIPEQLSDDDAAVFGRTRMALAEGCARALAADYQAEYRSSAWKTILSAIGCFLIPSLLLLAIGLGVGWVRRGFQRPIDN